MVNQHFRWDFVGLSTDEKPTPETSEKVVDGSTFYCSDTSKLYVYCKDNWYERLPLGGGGGSSYTAGDGIDITNDTISVDTEVIQPKLTAGTNITISEDNVISAEGGGGATVVQTTGTSTTDVMSQDAVSGLLFQNKGDKQKVTIGGDITLQNVGSGSYLAIGERSKITGSNGTALGAYAESAGSSIAIGSATFGGVPTKANGGDSIAIGCNAQVTSAGAYSMAIGNRSYTNGQSSISLGYGAETPNNNSVSIGRAAKTTRNGEVNIGSITTNYGYNSTNYRVLGGVHDGQDAHDAVTVEQVNSVIDAINAALSTSIPHIGA